jgi:hypothetical protein
MYIDIQKQKDLGFSKRKTAEHLGVNYRRFCAAGLGRGSNSNRDKTEHPHVPWWPIVGMRHVLVYDDFEVGTSCGPSR